MTEEFVRRTGVIFRTGNYKDKNFSLDKDELRKAVAAFQPVKIDLAHTETPLDGKLGQLEHVEISEDGETLFGTAALPQWLDKLLDDGKRAVSCTWNRATKQLTGLALVTEPRLSDAALMAAFAANSMQSSSGAPSMQQIHDMCVALGATCAPVQQAAGAQAKPPAQKGKAQMSKDTGNDEVVTLSKPQSWWNKFLYGKTDAAFSLDDVEKLEGVAVKKEKPAKIETVDFAAQAVAAVQSDEARRKSIKTAAKQFAKEVITAGRALPAEKKAIQALFSQAAQDDTGSAATFSAGSRIEALKAAYAARPKLVDTGSATVDGNLYALFNQTESIAVDVDQAQVDKLMSATPLGKATLAAKNGAK